MAEIDSLEIKISAESKDAESSLDRIIQKIESLGQLAKANTNLPKVLSGLSSNVSTSGIDKVTDSITTLSDKSTSAANNFKENCQKITNAANDLGEKLSSSIANSSIDFGNENYRKSIQQTTEVIESNAERINRAFADLGSEFKLPELTRDIDAVDKAFADLGSNFHIPDIYAMVEPDIRSIRQEFANLGSEFHIPEVNGISEELHQIIQNIRTTADEVETQVNRVNEAFTDLGSEFHIPDPFEEHSANYFASDEFNESINNIVNSYRRANEEQKKFGNFSFGKLATDAAVLSGAIDKIGEKLSKLGDLGQKALGFMYIPLKGVVNEYKEKLEAIKGHFDEFFKKVKTGLTKLSAFWKRAMRTFTFMILRKAFTQIIKDIGEATESLALFSKEFGTTFNENISNAIADFKWIGKAIVGAFEPIINVVVPILNVLSAALVKVITLLGHFFAALTGQGYYMVAKKNVEDYAGSLKKAAKEAKKSIRPFDELNLITSGNKSDTDTGVNPAADWEMKPVSDKMKKFADMIKDLARKLWEPIKKAWDRTKDYVISGFKYMVSELGKLFKSIGRDFLEVWRQEATVKIFENIFKIVGDIERVIGNLAKRFREAWDEGEKGLHIFENIRDIIGILIQHVRNVTEYMVEWSDSIDFNPLLEGVERLTRALKKVADFIGSVFEDVMKNVVLKYIKWMIEEGTPHLLETITEIINAIDWEHLRRGLFIVEQAIEKLLENIHTGVTNAIGYLGKAFANFVNSEKFTKFMQALAHIMEQFTAERVEKVLEALGLAILQIAEAVADFVSSDKFLDFIDKIGKWIDSKSAEDLAGYVKGIIELTAAFKGLAAIAPALSSLIKTATMLKAVGDIGKIAKSLAGAGKAGKVADDMVMLPDLMTKKGFAPGVSKAQVMLENLARTASSTVSKITTAFSSISWSQVLFGDMGATMAAGGATAAATFATALIAGIAAAIGGFHFGKWLGKLMFPDQSEFYDEFSWFGEYGFFDSIGDAAKMAGEDIKEAFSGLGEKIKAAFEPVGTWFKQLWSDISGAASLAWQDIQNVFAPIASFFQGLGERIKAIFDGIWIIIKAVWMVASEWFNTNVIQPIVKAFEVAGTAIKNAFNAVVGAVKSVWNTIVQTFTQIITVINSTVIQPVIQAVSSAIASIQAALMAAWTAIQTVWNTIVTFVQTNIIQPVINAITVAITSIQTALVTVGNAIRSAFTTVVNSVKNAFTNLWNSIKSGARACFNAVVGVVERAINGIINGLNKFIGKFNDIVGKAASITGDSWGGVSSIPTITLPKFASGGFPEDGTFFRASHGEMIGEFDNGQSVVANNQQIVDGIKAGVIDGMMQILPSLAQAVSNDTNVVIEGDMSKMFRAMVKENYGANKRTFNASPLYS